MGVFSLTKEKNIVSCITNLTLIFLIKKTHKKINFQSNSISILLILQYYLFLTIKHNTIKSNFQIPQQDPIGYTFHDRNIFLGHILGPVIKIFLGCFRIALSTPTTKLGQCPPRGYSPGKSHVPQCNSRTSNPLHQVVFPPHQFHSPIIVYSLACSNRQESLGH